MNDLWKESTTGIIITIALLVVGTAYYFIADLGVMETTEGANSVLRSAQIKIAVADGTVIKLFALGANNALVKLPVSAGEPLPEATALVIGSAEAAMMREENLFAQIGDRLEGFFGITTTIGGILEPTNTIIDDMHFLSSEQYRELDGEEGRVYIQFTPEDMAKVFYYRAENESFPVPVAYSVGADENYKMHDLAGTVYYPVIIGSTEAAMMREENLFQKPGDTITGFFGKDVVIIGILEPTNTSLDMMHVWPVAPNEVIA
jgi:hypothetical protein